MDKIRQRITDRIDELGTTASEVSTRIGKNRGYLHDFLKKGSPKSLPYEIKLKVAAILGLDPSELGVTPFQPNGSTVGARRGGGLEEEAESYEPGPAAPFRPAPHIAMFRQRSLSLDQLHPRPILPGDVVMFDINQTEPDKIESGKVVIVQFYDKQDLTRCYGSAFRLFIKPNKLMTNSSDGNELISLDDVTLPFEPVIKGTMVTSVGPIE